MQLVIIRIRHTRRRSVTAEPDAHHVYPALSIAVDVILAYAWLQQGQVDVTKPHLLST